MRILPQALLRRGDADLGQQLDAAPDGCRRVHAEMRLQGLDELRADGQHRD